MRKFYQCLREYTLRILLVGILLATSFAGFGATYYSVADGNWNDASTWYPEAVPGVDDEVVIETSVSIGSANEFYISKVTIEAQGELTIEGDLIVTGDFVMVNEEKNPPVLVTGPNSAVIIFGNALLGNKVNLDLSSYFVVVGSFSKSGSWKQGVIDAEGAHVYVFGSFDSPWRNFQKCIDDPYAGTTDSENVTCDVGDYDDFLDLIDPDDLPDGVYEQIVGPVNVITPGSQEICFGAYSSDLVLTDESGTVTKWQTSTDAEFSSTDDFEITSTTLSGTSIGAITQTLWVRVVINDGGETIYSNIAVINLVDLAPNITQCPGSAEVACVKDLPVLPESIDIDDFQGEGGLVEDNCTADENLVFTYTDEIITTSGCEVHRTFTITNESLNTAQCVQVFTITDSDDPVFKDASGGYLPAFTTASSGCEIAIPEPDVEETCSFVSFEVSNESGTTISDWNYSETDETLYGSFPIGTTLLKWTITDECGHSAEVYQSVVVQEVTIAYDNNSTSTAVGSGVKPMLTSTHSYEVDGGIEESGYSYLWEIYTDADGDGTIDGTDAAITSGFTMSPDKTGAAVEITFESLTENTNYIISLIKTNTSTLCTKQETLAVVIQENTFDATLAPFGNHCQSGETDTPSKITWEVTFTGTDTEPFMFDYTVNWSDETSTIDVCSGSVEDITQSSSTLTHTSGCEDTGVYPFAVVSKAAGSLTVKLEYTLSSQTAKDFTVNIVISASDQFAVSEVDSSAEDNSETLNAWGVPNTSEIQTD